MATIAQPQQIEALAAQGDEHAAVIREPHLRPQFLEMPVHRGLMKADLPRAPTIMPKFGLQGSGFLGRVRGQIFTGRRFVRNSVLLADPGAEIDEPAAIAAEGSI